MKYQPFVVSAVIVATASVSVAYGPKPKPPTVTTVAVMDGAASDTLAVNVSELHSELGSVRCFLYDDEDDFPKSEKHIIGRAVAMPRDGKATCMFVGMHPNRDYATFMMHDEDNNGTLKQGHFGIPIEGYGFSNNVHPHLSAPSFDDCAFKFPSGSRQISIKPIY